MHQPADHRTTQACHGINPERQRLVRLLKIKPGSAERKAVPESNSTPGGGELILEASAVFSTAVLTKKKWMPPCIGNAASTEKYID